MFKIFSIILLIGAQTALATVRNAATVAYSDVVAAAALCVDGDTLSIPGGSAYWTNTFVPPPNISLTILGAGTNLTTIFDSIDKSTTTATNGDTKAQAVISWVVGAGKTNVLTGINFQPGNNNANRFLPTNSPNPGYFTAAVQFWGSCTNLRVHHVEFGELLNRGIYVNGGVCGVIDHCGFFYCKNNQGIAFSQDTLFGGSNGDGSWENAVNWGGPVAMYVEDCLFKPNANRTVGSIDGFAGGRGVVRYCTITNSYCTVHGTESSQRLRGHRSLEFYMNRVSIDNTFTPYSVDFRSGGGILFSNTITGPYFGAFKLSCYREFAPYVPWGTADGTKAWDQTDGVIYDTGTLTSGGLSTATDSGKSWTINQWVRYCFRQTNAAVTVTSGGVATATVSGAGWTANQWDGYEVTKLSTGEKSKINSGNTSTTITLRSDTYQITFSPGDVLVFSRSAEVLSNTAHQITVIDQGGDFPNYTFATGQQYEIRKVTGSLDSPGRGITTPISGGSTPNNQNLSQGYDPVYQWGNTLGGVNVTSFSVPGSSIINGRDYTNNLVKPGYTPYVYPHPFVSGNIFNPPTITTVADQTVNQNSSAGPISFTVGDVETPSGSLVMTAGSANTTLLPVANIVFGGSGSSRTVTLTPATGLYGTVAVTLTVTDTDGYPASTAFILTVNRVIGTSASGTTVKVGNLTAAQ